MFVKGKIGRDIICGIYIIICLPTQKIYVGSSVNILKRWGLHRHKLKKNKHFNPHLQKAWNKYGENNFKFETIELVDKNNLIKREIFWIQSNQSYNREYGFNIIKPDTPPMSGRLHTEKSKFKMSKAHKGKILTDEHKYNAAKAHVGSKRSQETKLKMSLALKGKKKSKIAIENWKKANRGISIGSKNPKAFLNEQIVKEIREEYCKYLTNLKPKVKNRVIQHLCTKFNLKKQHIAKIISNQIWRHI